MKVTLTLPEKHEFNKKITEVKKQREHEEEINRTKARSKASKIWDTKRTEGPTDHPYLISKKGTATWFKVIWRQIGCSIIRSKSVVLHSLQFISSDGEKKFLSRRPN